VVFFLKLKLKEQKEDVEKIDAHVETTHENVIQAEQSLRKAAKLKKMSYPLIGAVVGSCVGGPLGCLAGAKVGVFATVTCFVLGNIYNYFIFITFILIFNLSTIFDKSYFHFVA